MEVVLTKSPDFDRIIQEENERGQELADDSADQQHQPGSTNSQSTFLATSALHEQPI